MKQLILVKCTHHDFATNCIIINYVIVHDHIVIYILSNDTSFINFDAILRKLQPFSDGRLEQKILSIDLFILKNMGAAIIDFRVCPPLVK
jgi:hypothetical protein